MVKKPKYKIQIRRKPSMESHRNSSPVNRSHPKQPGKCGRNRSFVKNKEIAVENKKKKKVVSKSK